MEIFALLLVISQLWAASAVTASASREELVAEAIQEVQLQRGVSHSTTSLMANDNSAQLLNAFKRASIESLQEGNKQLMFEEMVKKAERKILENERKAKSGMKSGVHTQAEDLARELFHKQGSILNKDEIARILQESGCAEITMQVPDCSDAKIQQFRTVNGVCNNLQNPLFGAAHTPFSRLIPAQYEDGLSQLRGAMQNAESSLIREGPFSPPNPSPRLVSVSAVTDRPIDDERFSHILMQWGQFLDHDLDLAPAFTMVDCSGCSNTDKRCAPFRVPTDDPTFGDSSLSQICLPFVRSLPVCQRSPDGSVRPRQQVNELTSFIDGSQIYGSSEKVLNAVRASGKSGNGKLRTGQKIPANGGPSLPIDTDDLVECLGGHDCFLAGDVRVNEQVGLITMHTIWMREHNRIANELARLNPTWDSETVFQEARQIVGAELQKITFQDYLPLLLGKGFELMPNFSYNANTNPGIPNAFATAAFRFVHSQIRPLFDRLDQNFQPLIIGPLSLLDSFFQPNQYAASGGTDPILRGLLARQARRTDEFVIDVLTNHLFQTNTSSDGMDLASLNIQRGRDHGLPPYMTWKRWARRQCGVSSDFNSDLTMIRLLQTYGTLETVDLWVGGLAETPLPGGVLGATFACIFAKAFSAIRNGDRFYYDNSDLSNATFTSQQLAAINNASLSRVICDNADNIKEIQPNAFRGDQPREPCTSLPVVDLTAWMDPCYIRLSLNPQMMDVSFRSFSRLQESSGSTSNTSMEYDVIIPPGGTSACLPFLCPQKGTTTLMVSPTGRVECTVQPNDKLPNNMAFGADTYIGNIQGKVRQSEGLYSDLGKCQKRNSCTGLAYTCGSTTPDQLSKDALAVQELVDELQSTKSQLHKATVQTPTNKVFRKEISVDDPLIPKAIQTLLHDQAFMQQLRRQGDDDTEDSDDDTEHSDNDTEDSDDDTEDSDDDTEDSRSKKNPLKRVVWFFKSLFDKLKDIKRKNERMDPCYIRLTLNPQMMDVSFRSFSRLQETPDTSMEYNVTIPPEGTSACLPFLCPDKKTTTNLMVSPTGRVECTVQPNDKLPNNVAFGDDTYTGNIQGKVRQSEGLYSDLGKCQKRNSRTGLAYMCGSITPDQLSKDALAVQELVGELQSTKSQLHIATVQTPTNRLFGKEISIDEAEGNDDTEDPDKNPDLRKTVIGFLQSAIDKLKDIEEKGGSEEEQKTPKNGRMDPCYIRLSLNPQTMDVSFSSFSRLLETPDTTMESNVTIPPGGTFACLAFLCPQKGTTNLMVSPTGRVECTVQPNDKLPNNMAFGDDTYTGNIQGNARQSEGLYRDLGKCQKRNSRTGLAYTCGSTTPVQLSKDALVVQELVGELQFTRSRYYKATCRRLTYKLFKRVVWFLRRLFDKLKDIKRKNRRMDPCYIRLSLNPQMMDVSFRSFSRLQETPDTTVTMESNVIIPPGGTSACLAFLCPQKGTTTLMVSPTGSVVCTVQPNDKLPNNMAFGNESYTGNIQGNVRQSEGLYSDLGKCQKRNSRTGLAYTCGSTTPDQLSKDALVVQELVDELQSTQSQLHKATVQTPTNRLFGKEISIDEAEGNDDTVESDKSLDSMETVIGFLQSAIDKLEDMEEKGGSEEEQKIAKNGGMTGQKDTRDLEREKVEMQSSKLPHGEDVARSGPLAKLLSQLQKALDELDS